jgi:ubiquinone/menaquinone biosynthesis C-methylase UbiE
MSDNSASDREANRIRAVYERRAASGREDRYSLFQPGHLFHAQVLERAIISSLRQEGIRSLSGLRILDVGCGGASWLGGLTRYGAAPGDLHGIDLREAVLPKSTTDLKLALAAGDCLPFRSKSFDIVCQLTMMSSVLDRAMRRRIAQEMARVLRPGGIILWYDFTANPLNPDVAGVRQGELRELFPAAQMRAERVTLAPPLTRLLAPRIWLACEILERIPWLRTHLVATIRPADTSA